ncbi:MAG: crossover junction endodeoxyribonuclease RuvC [Deltaproteobacteria bacterium]|nr:crossover junction endodeoxyribonuclease RuvC [Deltaproteobacteria bacterium]
MIILGIDPGSRITGFGLVQKSGNRHSHIENGAIFLDDRLDFSAKLKELNDRITKLIKAHQPDVLVVENIFFHKNPKSTQKLGEVRGAVILTAALNELPLFEYTPLEVKKAITGYGRATKDQIQYMICKLLNLKDRAEENASDALAIALCHAQNLGGTARTAATPNTLTPAQSLLRQASYFRSPKAKRN